MDTPPQKISEISTESRLARSAYGKRKASSEACACPAENASTSQSPSPLVKRRKIASAASTPTAPRCLRKPSARKQISVKLTQTTSSSASAPGCKPFWNASSLEASRTMWLPTATASRALASSSLTGAWRSITAPSWFSVQVTSCLDQPPSSLTTSWLSQHISSLNTLDDEVLKTATAVAKAKNEKVARLQETAEKRKLGKHLGAAKKQAAFDPETYVQPTLTQKDVFARKAKLRPTPLQKKLLDRWASCSNQVYNLCVNEYKIHGTQPPKATLRTLLKDTWKVGRPWLAAVPYEILDASIDDFDTIFKQQATVRREKRLAGDTTSTPFTIKFRSKKRASVSLKVRCRASYKSSVSEGGQVRACFYVTKMDAFLREELRLPKGQPLSDDVLYCAGKELPLEITHDSELVRTPLGEYFFCYSTDRPPSEHRSTSDRLRVVAGDPGVRTFNTFYDPDGYIIEVGANDMSKLRNRGNAVDILKAKIARYKKKKKKVKVRRMQKALLRVEEKIKNMVDEVHKDGLLPGEAVRRCHPTQVRGEGHDQTRAAKDKSENNTRYAYVGARALPRAPGV